MLTNWPTSLLIWNETKFKSYEISPSQLNPKKTIFYFRVVFIFCIINFTSSFISLKKCPHPCQYLPVWSFGKSFTQPFLPYLLTISIVYLPPVMMKTSSCWIPHASLKYKMLTIIKYQMENANSKIEWIDWDPRLHLNLYWKCII